MVWSEMKISPSSFGMCAFRDSMDGVYFVLSARGVGGSGRVASDRAGEIPKMLGSVEIQ